MSKFKDEEDLSEFLSKVDQIGELVKGLATSEGGASAARALEKADQYLQQKSPDGVVVAGTDSKVSLDRTVINKAPSMAAATSAADGGVSVGGARAGTEQAEFLRSLEEDARERGERRRERERRGKEAKKHGNVAFKEGAFEKAVECFAQAIEETPWDLTLYTNRALTHNRMGNYKEAIEDCNTALRFEEATLKAYIHKGNALSSLAQPAEAKECFEKALELFPQHSDQINTYLKHF